MKTPEQIMAQMYKSTLIIMVILLIASGIASFFDAALGGVDLSTIFVRFYLLVIPAVIMAFTITMFVRRVTKLAIAGLVLSSLWLVFKWMG